MEEGVFYERGTPVDPPPMASRMRVFEQFEHPGRAIRTVEYEGFAPPQIQGVT